MMAVANYNNDTATTEWSAEVWQRDMPIKTNDAYRLGIITSRHDPQA